MEHLREVHVALTHDEVGEGREHLGWVVPFSPTYFYFFRGYQLHKRSRCSVGFLANQ